MNLVEELQRARAHAGLPDYSIDQLVDLAEKKLSGKEKEDFLAKMAGKSNAGRKADDGKKTKKEDEVDDGKPGPTKGARRAMDDAQIKPSTKKGKKKVSEQINSVLEAAGVKPLSEADASKVDEAYPEADE